MPDVDPRWLADAVAAVRALEKLWYAEMSVEIDDKACVGVRTGSFCFALRPPHRDPEDLDAHAAALRAALAVPAAKEEPMYRYEVRDDVVLDRTTGLEWQRKHAGPMTWKAAMDYVPEEGYGWRLPTIEELITLIDFSQHGPASAFPGMPSEWFWSSSSCAGSASSAWLVLFSYGSVHYSGKTSAGYVRCVRRRGDSTPTATEKREGRCGTCGFGLACGTDRAAACPFWHDRRGWKERA